MTENQTATNSDTVASCSPRILKRNTENGLILLTESQKTELAEKLKKLNPELPTIGLLMYDDVLTTELTAPMDVFTKLTEDGENSLMLSLSQKLMISL